MRKYYNKAKWHFKKNFLFWWVFSLILLVFSGAIFLEARIVKFEIAAYFKQIDEKKNLELVDNFHEGVSLLYGSFLETQSKDLQDLAESKSFREVFESGNLDKMQQLIDEQRMAGKIFENNLVLDKTGKVLSVSSDDPNLFQFIGQDFSEREYVKETLRSKSSKVIHVSKTLLGKNKLFFTAPALDAEGNVSYVLTGSITMGGLMKRMNMQPNPNRFESLLLDKSGEIILRNGESLDQRVEIISTDKLAALMISEKKNQEDIELNYEGKRAFFVGKPLNIGQRGELYLVAYNPTDQFDTEINQIVLNVDRIFVEFAAWGIMVLFLFVIVLQWLIKKHDKKFNL